jgi:hypothetical protein
MNSKQGGFAKALHWLDEGSFAEESLNLDDLGF